MLGYNMFQSASMRKWGLLCIELYVFAPFLCRRVFLSQPSSSVGFIIGSTVGRVDVIFRTFSASEQRLMAEAAAEAEQTAWCNTELAGNKVTRDKKSAEVLAAQTDIDRLYVSCRVVHVAG